MPALTVARMTIEDPAKFNSYASRAPNSMETYGGEFVYGGKVEKCLTGGEAGHVLTVIYEFPSMEAVEDWFLSPSYQLLLKGLEGVADMEITSYEVV
jgi:uncharacterized protein (DUF1330 family)